jgi:hypothetical protein
MPTGIDLSITTPPEVSGGVVDGKYFTFKARLVKSFLKIVKYEEKRSRPRGNGTIVIRKRMTWRAARIV